MVRAIKQCSVYNELAKAFQEQRRDEFSQLVARYAAVFAKVGKAVDLLRLAVYIPFSG